MKKRLVSSLALAGALTFGLAGCTAFSQIATEIKYSPSDGIIMNASDNSVQIRNILAIGKRDSGVFNLSFWVHTDSPQQLDFAFTTVDGKVEHKVISVSGDAGAKYGVPKSDKMMIINLPEQMIGSTVPLTVTSAKGIVLKGDVPVVDGSLKEYASYIVDKNGNPVGDTGGTSDSNKPHGAEHGGAGHADNHAPATGSDSHAPAGSDSHAPATSGTSDNHAPATPQSGSENHAPAAPESSTSH